MTVSSRVKVAKCWAYWWSERRHDADWPNPFTSFASHVPTAVQAIAIEFPFLAWIQPETVSGYSGYGDTITSAHPRRFPVLRRSFLTRSWAVRWVWLRNFLSWRFHCLRRELSVPYSIGSWCGKDLLFAAWSIGYGMLFDSLSLSIWYTKHENHCRYEHMGS